MDGSELRAGRSGVNQTGVRAHNERLILSVIHRDGALAGSDIAKKTELSPQTVSNILRKLEADGFVTKGEPQRGRVGKPSIPMELNPFGALSFGLKLGRRSAELALLNLNGEVLGQRQSTYPYPMPDRVFAFLREGMEALSAPLSEDHRNRIAGIGIAAPSEMWSWVDVLGAPSEFSIWRDVDFAEEVARFSDLPVFSDNDATAACRAEHSFGRGRERDNYAYFFIGSFIGGGVVFNGSVIDGPHGNAGSFGSLHVPATDGGFTALIDEASLYLLENALSAHGINPANMWGNPQDWSEFGAPLDQWIAKTGRALAYASRSVCAVIDFKTVLIDGAFPADVRTRLVTATQNEIEKLDMRGLFAPSIEAARVGGNARVIGAASTPIFQQFFLR